MLSQEFEHFGFCFFFRNSSLLLASRLREEGDSFFFGDAMTSFPPGGVHGEGKVGPNVEGEGEGLSDDEIKSQSFSD